jgi:hypothetical protein
MVVHVFTKDRREYKIPLVDCFSLEGDFLVAVPETTVEDDTVFSNIHVIELVLAPVYASLRLAISASSPEGINTTKATLFRLCPPRPR